MDGWDVPFKSALERKETLTKDLGLVGSLEGI